MKYIIRLNLLTVFLPMCFWVNAQSESNDTLFIQRNEKGKIESARFQATESFGIPKQIPVAQLI